MSPPQPYNRGRYWDQTRFVANKPEIEVENSIANYVGSFKKNVTIAHWQLRDLLHCPTIADEVFAVQNRKVLRHNLSSSSTEVACDLSFEPTCMAASDGYLAAGGQRSQLDIRLSRRLGPLRVNDSDAITTTTTYTSQFPLFNGQCGGSVNNALRIAEDASHQLRLFVSNNDKTIKVFSLSVGALISLISCPVAVNHCAVSPCRNKLVCVGDDEYTYLYQATDTDYRLIKKYSEADDAGMACDWSKCPSGSLFAAASQDGVCAVWDHRCDGAPVARFRTPLALRNVKFSPLAALDLLAFSEHRGRCHVADTRMWPKQQILEVGEVPEMVDISGMCFSPCGKMLYVGCEDQIVAYHVDTGARRSFAAYSMC